MKDNQNIQNLYYLFSDKSIAFISCVIKSLSTKLYLSSVEDASDSFSKVNLTQSKVEPFHEGINEKIVIYVFSWETDTNQY